MQVPYPERYHLAVDYQDGLPDDAFSDDDRLLFYALSQQVRHPGAAQLHHTSTACFRAV